VSQNRVLIVEDDTRLRQALRATFQTSDFDVVAVGTGEESLHSVSTEPPDLMVLDLNLPGLSGIDVLERLRRFSSVPVVVLTVRDQIDDKVLALDAGADDYVVKPFDPAELLARARAHLRRGTDARRADARTTIGSLQIDLSLRQATWDGQRIAFAPLEFRLLEVLVSNPGRLLTREELLEAVWGSTDSEHRVRLRVTMTSLRKKLHDDASDPRLIVTEPGLGYRWVGGEEPGT